MGRRGMTANTDDARRRAIDKLEGLGLSAYAARTFVALVELESGTAKSISDTVNVPRTRVYDAADELSEWGLVEIESATPRRFHAVSIEHALFVLGTEYTDRIDDVTAALEAVGSTESSLSRDDLWLSSDPAAITERTSAVIADAQESVLLATTDDGRAEPLADALVTAAKRGVEVRAIGVADRFDESPVTVVDDDRPWNPAVLPLSTVLLADGEDAVVTFQSEESLAFWSRGESNNLLVLLRALLGIE
ncbi:TrmB family transcriptional regulator [Halomicrobium sp. IBSBa]|nr:TrmB family transcriptional regulator [Halomicrobium sp. IBSBa]